MSGNQAAVDRIWRVAVEDLVLSQEGKPKRHRSACEILCETAMLSSSVHTAQDNLLSSPAHILQTSCAQLLSEADKQPYRLQ